MTKEEKELLLKDLSARLPYGIICNRYANAYELVEIDIKRGLVYLLREEQYVPYSITSGDVIKPYLRPMSSMTQEEMDNFQQCLNIIENENYGDGWSPVAWGQMAGFIHYCNEHHLDYNGLIAMGLALEAPDGMYNN